MLNICVEAREEDLLCTGYNDYADKTECHSPNFSFASKTTDQMGHPVQAPKNNIPFCLAECALP